MMKKNATENDRISDKDNVWIKQILFTTVSTLRNKMNQDIKIGRFMVCEQEQEDTTTE